MDHGIADVTQEHNQLSLAEIAVEKAAIYEERAKRHSSSNKQMISRLSCDYVCLRITLVSEKLSTGWRMLTHGAKAWKQDRLDLARLMYAKINSIADTLDVTATENLADVLLEIGKSIFKQGDSPGALYWLDGAYEELSKHEMESMSGEAGDLKVSIMHHLVKVLMRLEGEEHRARAWNIVRDLEINHGGRLAVSLLKLDLFAQEPEPSAQDYQLILDKIILSVHLTEANVKTILHHLHQLRRWSPLLAQKSLATLISQRLLEATEPAWIEKAIVMSVWNVTTTSAISDPIQTLRDLFDEVAGAGNLANGLGQQATHAAQILLWRRIESSFQQEQNELSERWCHLSLHPIFRQSGSSNIGKLQRKLMLCALNRADPLKARETYLGMSSAIQSESTSQYLLYKSAIRTQDMDTATECLEKICKNSTNDSTILYACVLEAQRIGDLAQSSLTLQKLLQNFDYDVPAGVNLPAILRCAARLLFQQLNNEDPPSQRIIEDICDHFERSVEQVKRCRRDGAGTAFTVAELDWFSRNSYNLALKHCTSWDPVFSRRMIDSCISLIDLYPKDLEANVLENLALRKLLSLFLAGSLSVAMARQEDHYETQLQLYLDVRKRVGVFRSMSETLGKMGEAAKEDLSHKFTSLLAYDFEAAARLKAWDSLRGIIEVCAAMIGDRVFRPKVDWANPGMPIPRLHVDFLRPSQHPHLFFFRNTHRRCVYSKIPAPPLSATTLKKTPLFPASNNHPPETHHQHHLHPRRRRHVQALPLGPLPLLPIPDARQRPRGGIAGASRYYCEGGYQCTIIPLPPPPATISLKSCYR